jgi:hypothetical protein
MTESSSAFYQRMANDCRALGRDMRALGEEHLADLQDMLATSYQMLCDYYDDPGVPADWPVVNSPEDLRRAVESYDRGPAPEFPIHGLPPVASGPDSKAATGMGRDIVNGFVAGLLTGQFNSIGKLDRVLRMLPQDCQRPTNDWYRILVGLNFQDPRYEGETRCEPGEIARDLPVSAGRTPAGIGEDRAGLHVRPARGVTP